MTDAKEIQKQVDQNYEAFKTMLPELLKANSGRWALVHNQELVAVFDTARDAQVAGESLYKNRLFSVQEVTNRVADLGWFSHAVS